MKKFLFTPILILSTSICFSQTKYENDTLYTQSGFKVYEGQELNIGVGATPDGDFKFIRRNSSGFGTAMVMTDNNSYNKSQLSLPRSMAGHKGKVIKIVKRGNSKIGITYEPLITFGSGRYEIDIDNAIGVGELNVPEQFRPNNNKETIVVKQPISVADELTKLKKLYDDSVLTKQEYETQKAKLLAQ